MASNEKPLDGGDTPPELNKAEHGEVDNSPVRLLQPRTIAMALIVSRPSFLGISTLDLMYYCCLGINRRVDFRIRYWSDFWFSIDGRFS